MREHYDEFSAVPTTFSDGTSVEYRVVEYSLQELETVKDTLAGYMNQYRIAMLDANEMTNQVDVALFNYDSNVRNEILSIAESIHPNIPINFIDYSDCTIQSTVAFEKPEYPADSNILDLDSASIQSDITVFSGQPIQMNGGYYTLGPITSSQTAFSAGHGVSMTGTSVYTGFLKLIGVAHGYYGGRYGDWSRISLGSNVDTAVQHRTASPVMGQSVRMLGAVSGITNGSVSNTNIDVYADAPWANLTGMCSATYSCQRGDSGAAILLSNNSCVGIQSSATFDVNGNWSGVSYFIPADKFYL